MRRTNLRGHALWGEGKPFVPGDETPWLRAGWGIGYGVCECGEASPRQLDSDAARKRWHAQHKDDIRHKYEVRNASPAPVLGQGEPGP